MHQMGWRTRFLDVTGGMRLSGWGHGRVRRRENKGIKGRMHALLPEVHQLSQQS